jgi:hypothetical protein
MTKRPSPDQATNFGVSRVMADPMTDERVAAALRTFIRGCGPVVTRLSKAGRLGPAGGGVEERSASWVNRVGRLTALAASVTGLAGALGDRLPLQDILGAAGQGLLLCAIAGEHGVEDQATRVRLLAAVLFKRDIDPVTAAGDGVRDPTPVPAPSRRGVKPAATWLWRQGRLLLAASDELEKRPHGRVYHRALGMLPVVGMAGDYLGERAALKRAARAAHHWLHTRAPAA